MNRRFLPRLPTLLIALVLPLALTACGNKGPLVLPDAPAADAPVGEAPAADTPAETAAAPAADATTDAPQPPPNRDR